MQTLKNHVTHQKYKKRVTEMSYVLPEISKSSFHCPCCGTYAHMKWYQFSKNTQVRPYTEAECSHCAKSSLWLIHRTQNQQGTIRPTEGVMLYPEIGLAPVPELDMPEDVKLDYEEAAKIATKSPRGAAALLRLGLQKLCIHLGKEGKNINDDIRALAADNILSPMVIKVADTVRITGNNAVHPGRMSPDDVDQVSLKLFDLLNFIVRKAITEPRELEALYNKTPSGVRASAEKQDAKNKSSS